MRHLVKILTRQMYSEKSKAAVSKRQASVTAYGGWGLVDAIAYLLPAASAILDGMASFNLDLLRKNGRAGLIATRVIGVDALQNRGDSRTNPNALAPEPGGEIGGGGRGLGFVSVCSHILVIPVQLLLFGGCHDEMRARFSTLRGRVRLAADTNRGEFLPKTQGDGKGKMKNLRNGNISCPRGRLLKRSSNLPLMLASDPQRWSGTNIRIQNLAGRQNVQMSREKTQESCCAI
jgi:hypothetical protein